jgi:hypothetical protein
VQIFVRDHHAIIAAPLQRDVDGIPKGRMTTMPCGLGSAGA